MSYQKKNETMIDIENASREELITEYNKCMDMWGMYSCDCFGYYITALHRAIVGIGKGFDLTVVG